MKGNYTESDGSLTPITFDDLQYKEIDRVDHSVFYECRGCDSLGREYSGQVEYCCGDYELITDIQRETWMHRNKKPYQARVLLKSIKYWQSVVSGAVEPKRPIAYYKNKLSYYTQSDVDYLVNLTK